MPQPVSTGVAPDAARLANVIAMVRAGTVRVHCITGLVAAERTANTLLALDVRPSLTINAPEVGEFVRKSDSLLINLGMSDPMREAAIPLAIEAARIGHKPWVLDPVFVNLSRRRLDLAASSLAQMPNVLKANRAEAFLADGASSATACVITGAVDHIRLGPRNVTVANGHPLTAQVTATGCALGAVLAACLAVESDPVVACAAGLAAYGIAAERAGAAFPGKPASFGVALIDELAGIDREAMLRYAKVS